MNIQISRGNSFKVDCFLYCWASPIVSGLAAAYELAKNLDRKEPEFMMHSARLDLLGDFSTQWLRDMHTLFGNDLDMGCISLKLDPKMPARKQVFISRVVRTFAEKGFSKDLYHRLREDGISIPLASILGCGYTLNDEKVFRNGNFSGEYSPFYSCGSRENLNYDTMKDVLDALVLSEQDVTFEDFIHMPGNGRASIFSCLDKFVQSHGKFSEFGHNNLFGFRGRDYNDFLSYMKEMDI